MRSFKQGQNVVIDFKSEYVVTTVLKVTASTIETPIGKFDKYDESILGITQLVQGIYNIDQLISNMSKIPESKYKKLREVNISGILMYNVMALVDINFGNRIIPVNSISGFVCYKSKFPMYDSSWIEQGAFVTNSILKDAIIGTNVHVSNSAISNSTILWNSKVLNSRIDGSFLYFTLIEESTIINSNLRQSSYSRQQLINKHETMFNC
jgi:hypothetical protein